MLIIFFLWIVFNSQEVAQTKIKYRVKISEDGSFPVRFPEEW